MVVEESSLLLKMQLSVKTVTVLGGGVGWGGHLSEGNFLSGTLKYAQ